MQEGMVALVRAMSARRKRRGFSLIELLVVVVVIGLLAALAIPTMTAAGMDRRAYNDAAMITQLFRSARTRAIGRGGAVLITMDTNTNTRGIFTMYEAVAPNAGGAGNARTPFSSCNATWLPLDNTNANIVILDSVNLNATSEATAGILATINVYSPTLTTPTQVNVCWTPLGRSFMFVGAPANGMFVGLQATVNPVDVTVTRTGGGTIRSVLLPPNGMARLFSHV
jgi:prepilin-type N-terminal cleavage/methylation domain-containing protein